MNKNELRDEEYTFNMFIMDLRKNFLDPQWINQILRNIIYARMAETENFESYANRVLSGNNLLAGTENHLPKPILCDTIENHLAEYLSLKIDSLPSSEREHMIQLESLDDWLIFMRRLDNSARAELQCYKNLTTRKRGNDENQGDITIKHSRALPSTTDTTLPNSQTNNRPPFSTTQHNRPSYHTNRPPYASGANALAYTGRSHVPRLTDDDREILELHHGCKKCRRFYVQHDHLNCPNDFPDASLYTPLTQETAADMYKASQQPGYDAFHGIDITTMRVSRVAPIFAWGGPPLTTLLLKPHDLVLLVHHIVQINVTHIKRLPLYTPHNIHKILIPIGQTGRQGTNPSTFLARNQITTFSTPSHTLRHPHITRLRLPFQPTLRKLFIQMLQLPFLHKSRQQQLQSYLRCWTNTSQQVEA